MGQNKESFQNRQQYKLKGLEKQEKQLTIEERNKDSKKNNELHNIVTD